MSFLTILDRLLEQSSTAQSQEHLLEQNHYALDNVHQRSLSRFDELVTQISNELGCQPEFNANTDPQDGNKNPMPAWVMGGAKACDASVKMMRLSYWKRDGGVSYLLLRQELDSKDRPKYYDIVLGGRRRNRTDTTQVKKLRDADTSFLGWLKRMIKSKGN